MDKYPWSDNGHETLCSVLIYAVNIATYEDCESTNTWKIDLERDMCTAGFRQSWRMMMMMMEVAAQDGAVRWIETSVLLPVFTQSDYLSVSCNRINFG